GVGAGDNVTVAGGSLSMRSLVISNASGQGTAVTVGSTNTTVNGRLSITNGAGSSTIVTLAGTNLTVTADVSIQNGSGDAHAVIIAATNAANLNTVTGMTTITNGFGAFDSVTLAGNALRTRS